MPPTTTSKAAFDLKSTAWVLTAMRLHTADIDALAAALDESFGDSPGVFDDDPLVIDLSPLAETGAEVDFSALAAHLRRHRLRPIAVQGGTPEQMAAGHAAGLAQAMEPEGRPEPRAAARTAPRPPTGAEHAGEVRTPPHATQTPPQAAETPSQAAETPPQAAETPPQAAEAPPIRRPAAATAAPTLVVDKPLRSGQRVYARGGDLVVMSVVSFGAEVIADGHIHVYAPLRGRAMAGARGDTRARIFSTCMEPQLVSIAGIYRTTETPLPAEVAGRPAQVRLEGERLLFEPLPS
jgi:septum site-determining protein MinC